MDEATRAAPYARRSTGGLQLDKLRAVAARRGLHLVAELVDEGLSGATTSRPGFDARMNAAQAGKFEHLLVWKLDLPAGWGVSSCSVRDAGIDTTSAHRGPRRRKLRGC